MNKMYLKLFSLRILKRVYLERLGEPFIYNFVSIFVWLFGRFSKKIEYDLVPRQPYAFGVDLGFQKAKEIGAQKILLLEFGVAAGAGVNNLAFIARKLSHEYGIDFEVVGFDTGSGMPEAVDFRDHPEKYRGGDYPMGDPQRIRNLDQEKIKLYIGNVSTTLAKFFAEYENSGSVVGFISIDLDYYSSTKDTFSLFSRSSNFFLPTTPMYLDDVNNIDHNPYCGELLAVHQFNAISSDYRKITKMNQLRNWRLFKNALWLDQMYFLHVFDHAYRTNEWHKDKPKGILINPYLAD